MPAGQYRHRIEVTDSVVTGQNSFGEDIVSTVVIGRFWCLVVPAQGTELVTQEQRFAKATYEIKMRRQPGILFRPKMTATWLLPTGDRVLDIQDVRDPGERSNPELLMTAQDFAG